GRRQRATRGAADLELPRREVTRAWQQERRGGALPVALLAVALDAVRVIVLLAGRALLVGTEVRCGRRGGPRGQRKGHGEPEDRPALDPPGSHHLVPLAQHRRLVDSARLEAGIVVEKEEHLPDLLVAEEALPFRHHRVARSALLRHSGAALGDAPEEERL